MTISPVLSCPACGDHFPGFLAGSMECPAIPTCPDCGRLSYLGLMERMGLA